MTETEKAAEDAVEMWHKNNNWVPTERSVLPALDAFLAGAAYERERAKGLEGAIEDIMSALFLECQPDKGHIFGKCDDIALPALKKWRQHDSKLGREDV